MKRFSASGNCKTYAVVRAAGAKFILCKILIVAEGEFHLPRSVGARLLMAGLCEVFNATR